MFISMYLISIIIWALLCYWIANRNGRDKVLGLVMGFIFGIFAFVIYLIMGESEVKKAERLKKVLDK